MGRCSKCSKGGKGVMFEEIISFVIVFLLGGVSFFTVGANLFSKGKRTDPTRAELEEVGKHQQDATREVGNARKTVNNIRQSTIELADATRTSDTIIEECKQILDEIRNRNPMEDNR